jgi:hypothetical protein
MVYIDIEKALYGGHENDEFISRVATSLKGARVLLEADFTEKDLALLETLRKLIKGGVREHFDEKAAVLLKCSPVTVRTRLYRMSLKYEAAKKFCKEYRSWQQRLYQKSGAKFHSL